MRRNPWLVSILFAILLGGALYYLYLPRKAEAACGASVSTCKSCHEIQGQKPVSKSGDWHIQHAFGDFCEFCHAGVVTERSKEKAHQGMRQPLADPQKSCGSCHQADLAARAAKYGSKVNPGPSNPGPAAPVQAPAGGSSGPAPAAPAPVSSKDLIDYNKQLTDERGTNRGNAVLVVLNLLAAAGFATTAWTFEKGPLSSAAQAARQGRGAAPATPTPGGDLLQDAITAALVNLLASMDQESLQALKTIASQGRRGENLLLAASRLDLELLERLKKLSPEDLALLLSLARRS